MQNIPNVKMGLISVSRSCFPVALSQRRREAVAAAEEEARTRAIDTGAVRAATETAPEPPREPAPKPRPARKTRREAEEELYQSIHDDHLWLNNPVMVRGLGLAPIVAMAINGDYALMLCAAAALLLRAARRGVFGRVLANLLKFGIPSVVLTVAALLPTFRTILTTDYADIYGAYYGGGFLVNCAAQAGRQPYDVEAEQ